MEGQCCGPQPLVSAIDELLIIRQAGLRVSEQGTEAENLQRHPSDDTRQIVRALEILVFEERQGFCLPTRGRDAKRNRRSAPLEDSVGESEEEDCDGGIRNDDPEEELEIGPTSAHIGDQEQNNNCNKGV